MQRVIVVCGLAVDLVRAWIVSHVARDGLEAVGKRAPHPHDTALLDRVPCTTAGGAHGHDSEKQPLGENLSDETQTGARIAIRTKSKRRNTAQATAQRQSCGSQKSLLACVFPLSSGIESPLTTHVPGLPVPAGPTLPSVHVPTCTWSLPEPACKHSAVGVEQQSES